MNDEGALMDANARRDRAEDMIGRALAVEAVGLDEALVRQIKVAYPLFVPRVSLSGASAMSQNAAIRSICRRAELVLVPALELLADLEAPCPTDECERGQFRRYKTIVESELQALLTEFRGDFNVPQIDHLLESLTTGADAQGVGHLDVMKDQFFTPVPGTGHDLQHFTSFCALREDIELLSREWVVCWNEFGFALPLERMTLALTCVRSALAETRRSFQEAGIGLDYLEIADISAAFEFDSDTESEECTVSEMLFKSVKMTLAGFLRLLERELSRWGGLLLQGSNGVKALEPFVYILAAICEFVLANEAESSYKKWLYRAGNGELLPPGEAMRSLKEALSDFYLYCTEVTGSDRKPLPPTAEEDSPILPPGAPKLPEAPEPNKKGGS